MQVMARRRNFRSFLLIVVIGLAIATGWGSVSAELEPFRVLLTESGLYVEFIYDFERDRGITLAGPRGRFFSLPGVALDWPFMAMATPHWLHVIVALVWFVIPRLRRRTDGAHRCAACGYDLTGNVSGKCSECGTKKPEDDARE